jgi:predicted molibdopterin-dependent oxidoreductase YjgC
LADIATTCPFCGCGCGLYLHASGDRVAGVAPSRSHPVSQGRLCLKGWHAHELTGNQSRLTAPLIRQEGELRPASWKEAIAATAKGLSGVLAAAGPAAIGVLGSARAANEDNYALVRFARSILGTPNLDCSARLHSASSASPAVGLAGGELADLDRSDLILLVGNDPNEEHPAVSARIYRARQRGARLIVAAVRRHALARLADLHLRPAPGAGAHVLAALLQAVAAERPLSSEADALKESLSTLSPDACGTSADDIAAAARLFIEAGRVAIVYSPSLALAPDAGQALAALAGLAARGGREGLPEVSLIGLAGRNNLQGCLDMGVSPLHLPGYAPLDQAAPFAKAWGTPVAADRGLSAWQMLGRVKALYVMGDDPIRSLPDSQEAEKALAELQFLVVQDLFLSPVARLAHVVLPAAAFAERDGTFTSQERRVQRLRPAAPPPGEAREDWRILAEVSAALGKSLPYDSASRIFDEIASLLAIYGGLSYQKLDVPGGVRWPARGEGDAVLAWLTAWQRTPPALSLNGGRAQASEERPFVLMADPTLGPWEEETTIASTLTVGVEFGITGRDYPGGMLCLHPDDAQQLGLRAGRSARVTSSRGESTARVFVTDETPPGVALLPHWQAARLQLLEVATCPETGRPTLAPTPVAIAAG